jgi:hypothetical protein
MSSGPFLQAPNRVRNRIASGVFMGLRVEIAMSSEKAFGRMDVFFVLLQKRTKKIDASEGVPNYFVIR